MTVRDRVQVEFRLAAQARGEADLVLSRLIENRLATEQRCADAGRPDPMKSLTGSSALDRAIATTRDIIHRMDDLLRELRTDEPQNEESHEPALTHATTSP
ncbi:MAG: hypothetical protein ACYTGP_06855 [Planctomycetota bacterium]|jgi:hypothetical protein